MGLRHHSMVQSGPWIQPVAATHALNRSAGVSYPQRFSRPLIELPGNSTEFCLTMYRQIRTFLGSTVAAICLCSRLCRAAMASEAHTGRRRYQWLT